MIQYGKKKHFGFWCCCLSCGGRDRDEKYTMKKRARRQAKQQIEREQRDN